MPAQGSPRTRAVVVGASIAGLLTARVLSDHVDEVVVLEREHLQDAPEPRGHVPQGRHLHLLLSAGLDRLVDWFPGIDDELERQGAVWIDGSRGWLFQAGGYRVRGDWGVTVLSMTRPLLEQVVRHRVSQLRQVRIEDGVQVSQVCVAEGRVTGVLAGGAERQADLVVDCSGRSSRIAHQLESSGELVPPISQVVIDCAYASRFLPRGPDDFDGAFTVCGTTPSASFRGGSVLPVEGARWLVTLVGVHGEVPPTDDDGFLKFAHSLLSPTVGQLIEHTRPTSPVAAYRFPSSQRRHYERLVHLLPGLVTVGDAACSFNPIYAQGMACAAIQADALGAVLRTVPVGSAELPQRFHKRAAAILDTPWSIAVGADFLHPATTGPKARGTDLFNRYVLRVIRAGHTDLSVARTLNLVLNLAKPTSSLVRPATVARVLRASRHSPSATGEAPQHPWVAPPG